TTTAPDTTGATTTSSPGFGMAAALLALLSVTLTRRDR
ncbi:MAG: PGF-CTERM sorting domain-containing protein, partial [Halodesulfurarchaeum sp.]